jgi:hypothetical protein
MLFKLRNFRELKKILRISISFSFFRFLNCSKPDLPKCADNRDNHSNYILVQEKKKKK